MSYANRIWATSPAPASSNRSTTSAPATRRRNPELLQYLTNEFIQSQLQRAPFDEDHRQQPHLPALSLATNKWNGDDKINYSHAGRAACLPKCCLTPPSPSPAACQTSPACPKAPAPPLLCRCADQAAGWLHQLRPPRAVQSVCECERSNDVNLGPVMAPHGAVPRSAMPSATRTTPSPNSRTRSRRQTAHRCRVCAHPEPPRHRKRNRCPSKACRTR